MSRTLEQSFKLFNSSSEITFSVFDEKLLFIHSPFNSSQLVLNEIGVSMMDRDTHIQLQFYLKGGSNYLSLFFLTSEYNSLRLYFQHLRFPMHERPRVTND